MMKKNNMIRKGFTMVELTLAMLFISIILMTIAWLTIHITTVYEKGLSMKAVNSTAKELIDDFSRAIAGSPAFTVESLCNLKYDKHTQPEVYKSCKDDNARKFTYQQRYGVVTIRGKEDPVTVPTNGVFCTGRYSYLWNTAYVLNDEDYTKGSLAHAGELWVKEGGTPVLYKSNYRLLKVQDYDRKLCTEHIFPSLYAYDSSDKYEMDYDPGLAVDLLDNNENDLALYDMSIFKPTIHKNTSAGFYSGTFILATFRGGVDITATGEFCSDPPDGLNTDFTYCAINKFNFAMRAAGEKMITERKK